VKKLWTYNGGAVSGNVDVGVLDQEGTKLFSTGSTARSGTTLIQPFDIADTYLPVGGYYLALAHDGTSAFRRGSIGGGDLPRCVGMAEEADAFPLPAQAAFASNTRNFVPIFGLTGRVEI